MWPIVLSLRFFQGLKVVLLVRCSLEAFIALLALNASCVDNTCGTTQLVDLALHTGVSSINVLFLQSLGRLLQNVKVQGKSQDSISEEPAMSSDERESQTGSMSTGLDWTMISSDSGTEGTASLRPHDHLNCLSNWQDNL